MSGTFMTSAPDPGVKKPRARFASKGRVIKQPRRQSFLPLNGKSLAPSDANFLCTANKRLAAQGLSLSLALTQKGEITRSKRIFSDISFKKQQLTMCEHFFCRLPRFRMHCQG